jgi:hypothetical protein
MLTAGAVLSGALPQAAIGQSPADKPYLQRSPADSTWRTSTILSVSPNGQAPTVALVAAGALGAVSGTIIGGLVTGRLANDLLVGAGGAFLGQGLAVPLAVHLGNDRRGVLWPSLLAGAGVSAVAFGTAVATNSVTPLFITPLVHIPVSIMIERHSVRRANP